MRKSTLAKFLLFCGLFLMLGSARAQYVAIPDSSFGNWLHNNGFSSCLTGSGTTGWQLDTTCPAVINDTLINCQYSNIYNLTGIQYFKNLRQLNCSSNSLNNLPVLPSRLNVLDCSGNQLTSLPTLPAGLYYLNCRVNQLYTIPGPLPAGLIYLDCSVNQLISLTCTATPPCLPMGLTFLNCGMNQISGLPSLPAGLTLLGCYSNHLTTLPVLPTTLDTIYCYDNQLTSLPTLPAGIKLLDCGTNQLRSLPALPNSLTSLSCPQNHNITCLPPILHNVLTTFHILGTAIHCLPNRFHANSYDVNPDTMPICTAASGCEFYYNITGNIHNDTSATCISDSLYPGGDIRNIKIQLRKNGTVVQQFYTFGSGGYSFKTDSLVTYTVSIDTTGLPFKVACPNTDLRTVQLSATDTVKYNESFGITCPPYSDESVQSIYGRFRVGRQSTLHIIAGDMSNIIDGANCINHSYGQVRTIIGGPAHCVAAAPGAVTPYIHPSGDTIDYSIPDFDTVRVGAFDIIVQTDSTAAVGSQVCVTTTLLGSAEVNYSNDTLTQCFTVVNSYDPNLKTVSPVDSVDIVRQWLTYTVYFQNTGNDTAYTVVVRDTLSQYLDASSFQYLVSSHKAVIQLMGNAIVFTFPKINLVDSSHNEPLSHGWVQYKVKTKPNLPLGTQIKNTASIYFDLNSAIVTNTTVNTVSRTTGIYEPAIACMDVQLYPNPASESCTIRIASGSGQRYSAQILDISGREIIDLGELTNGVRNFSVSSYEKGIYMIRITNDKGQLVTKKLVIE